MRRTVTAIGTGVLGSILFFSAGLFFGGDQDSAYLASFCGFWIFVVIGWLGDKPKPSPTLAEINAAELAAGPFARSAYSLDDKIDAQVRDIEARLNGPPSTLHTADGADELLLTDVIEETQKAPAPAPSAAMHELELEVEAILRASHLGQLNRAIHIRKRSLQRLAESRATVELFDRMIRDRFVDAIADARIAGEEETVEKLKDAYADVMVLSEA